MACMRVLIKSILGENCNASCKTKKNSLLFSIFLLTCRKITNTVQSFQNAVRLQIEILQRQNKGCRYYIIYLINGR